MAGAKKKGRKEVRGLAFSAVLYQGSLMVTNRIKGGLYEHNFCGFPQKPGFAANIRIGRGGSKKFMASAGSSISEWFLSNFQARVHGLVDVTAPGPRIVEKCSNGEVGRTLLRRVIATVKNFAPAALKSLTSGHFFLIDAGLCFAVEIVVSR